MRTPARLDTRRPLTTFGSTDLPEIGCRRAVAVLHGEGFVPRARIGYYVLATGEPIREGAVYIHPEWCDRVLAAILAVRSGERVEMFMGRGSTRVWSAREGDDLGLCFAWAAHPRSGAHAEARTPAPPTVALVGDELAALEAALVALKSIPASRRTAS